MADISFSVSYTGRLFVPKCVADKGEDAINDFVLDYIRSGKCDLDEIETKTIEQQTGS